MDILNYFIPRLVARSASPYNKLIEVVSWRGQRMLYVNGIQQSGTYTIKLWKCALGELVNQKPKAERVLMLGVGGGTAIHQLTDLYAGASITAIDIDPTIIRVAKEYFGLDRIPGMILETSDASGWVVKARKTNKRYDVIIIDLYIGNDVPEFVSSIEFLTRVRALLAPEGVAVMNYFSYHDHKKRARLLLDKLGGIYQSVIRKDIFYNTFFFCH